jgi:anti-anti-sigma factor
MRATLAPTGDLDELVLDAFRTSLDEIADDCELELDFAAVTFCGSGCIRMLIETANRLTAGGGSLVIRNAQRIVRRAFAVGAVDFLLEPETENGDDTSAAS